MLSLFPLMKVLFSDGEKVHVRPVYEGIRSIDKRYLEDSLNYFITHNTDKNGALDTLICVVIFVLTTFLLKNLFNFISIVYMTYLNNGILKDLRNDVYQKVISLPVSFFSNERKGDLISRMTSDINTIKSAFLSILMMVSELLTKLYSL
jgi:subfamily B ATP-binding cassette protein MsbA